MTQAKSDLSEDPPYESDADITDEEIIEGLMEITALSRSDILKDEVTYYQARSPSYQYLAIL